MLIERPGPSLETPPHRTCLEHLPMEALGGHPEQVLGSSQVTPFEATEQQIYSELLPWLSFSLCLWGIAQPPHRGNLFRPLVSAILSFHSLRKVHDHSERRLTNKSRVSPFDFAVILPPPSSTQLWRLHQSVCQSQAPSFPPNTRSRHPPGEGKLHFSGQKPPPSQDCWSHSHPNTLHRDANLPNAGWRSQLDEANRTTSAKSRDETMRFQKNTCSVLFVIKDTNKELSFLSAQAQ